MHPPIPHAPPTHAPIPSAHLPTPAIILPKQTPKHLLTLRDGRTMLQTVADALAQVCERIVLVGNAETIASLDASSSCRHDARVSDLRSGLGPLGGIESLLNSGIDEAGDYLVCPCDMPRVTPEALRILLRRSNASATIVQLSSRQMPESLPVRINADALPLLRTLLDSDQRAIWHLMEALPAEVITIGDEWQEQFTNVNTPDDLQQLNEQHS